MSQTRYEQYLHETIIPELEQGRPGWDKPHTLKVVEYVKQILDSYETPPEEVCHHSVLIAAYLHDYGYMYFLDELLEGGITSGSAKAKHSYKSAEKWEEIQEHEVFSHLSNEQKERIKHLIVVHDKVEELRDTDELLLMEADTLGALATPSSVDKQGRKYQDYLQRTKHKRVSRFITPYAQTEAYNLLDQLIL